MTVQSTAANTCTTCVLPQINLPSITMPGLPNFDLAIMSCAIPPLNAVLPVINIPTDPNAIANYLNQVNQLISNWPSLPTSLAITPFMQNIKFPITCPSFNMSLGGINFPFPSLSGSIPQPPTPNIPGLTFPSFPALGLPNAPFSVSIGKYMQFIGVFVAMPFLMCQDILKGLAQLSLQMPTIAGVTTKITGFLTGLGFTPPTLAGLTKLIGCFATTIVNLFHQVLGV